MRKTFLALLLLVGGSFILSCSPGQKTLSLPAFSPSFPTPTTTGLTTSGIAAFNAFYDASQWTGDYLVGASIYVNGAPVSTAAVTLITPGGPFGIPEYNWYYSQVLPFNVNYDPGQVYTFQVTTAQGVASASCTMPGPMTVSSNGLTVTWPLPSNYGSVYVAKNNSQVYLTDFIWPPYCLPATIFSSGSGTYVYELSTSWNAYSFVNAEPGSSFQITTEPVTNVIK